jgi:hypothetical protein
MTFHETFVSADLDKGGQLVGNRKEAKIGKNLPL